MDDIFPPERYERELKMQFVMIWLHVKPQPNKSNNDYHDYHHDYRDKPSIILLEIEKLIRANITFVCVCESETDIFSVVFHRCFTESQTEEKMGRKKIQISRILDQRNRQVGPGPVTHSIVLFSSGVFTEIFIRSDKTKPNQKTETGLSF